MTQYKTDLSRSKKPDTRALKYERRVQSGCAAERYPRYGTGGSPGDTLVTGPAARRAIPALRDRRLAGRYPRYGTGDSPAEKEEEKWKMKTIYTTIYLYCL